MEYYAGRGPGPQRGNRGIWSCLGHPEVLRFWQHKVEAKASALHTFRWMVVDLSFTFQSRPFLHLSFTGHFLLGEIVALRLHQLNCTRIFDIFTSLCPLDLHPDLFCTVDQGSPIQRIWRGHRLRCQKFQRVISLAKN